MAVLALSIGAFAVTAADEPKEEKKDDKKGFGPRDPAATFKRMDADSDGKVTKEEFKKGFGGGFRGKGDAKPPEGKGDFSERIFERLDADKDGVLTEEEFKKGMANGPFGGGSPKGKFDQEKRKQFKDKLEKKPTDN